MLDKAKQESRSKDESIRKLDESLQNIENKARGKDVTLKTLQDKIKELENQLESKTSSHLESQKQVSHLSHHRKTPNPSTDAGRKSSRLAEGASAVAPDVRQLFRCCCRRPKARKFLAEMEEEEGRIGGGTRGCGEGGK